MTIQETQERISEYADPILNTLEASHEDWLRARKVGIGGSDAAGSIGLSPWVSPYSLWAEKTSGFVSDEDNRLMRWGRRLEEPIIKGFSEDTGTEVARHPVMLQSKKWPWMVVNLDGIASDAVVEAKNVGSYMADEWKHGQVPNHYSIQGQHALAVTGLDRVCFAALVGGNDPRYVEVQRDDDLIEKLVEGERKFWELVKANTPPALDDGSRATLNAIKTIYGNPDAESVVELPVDAIALISERQALKGRIKDDEAKIEAIETQIFAWMGNCEIGQVNGVTVFTWKKVTRAGYFVKPTTYRTARVPKPKSEKDKR
jgi:putative phage-type endonuclease